MESNSVVVSVCQAFTDFQNNHGQTRNREIITPNRKNESNSTSSRFSTNHLEQPRPSPSSPEKTSDVVKDANEVVTNLHFQCW